MASYLELGEFFKGLLILPSYVRTYVFNEHTGIYAFQGRLAFIQQGIQG